MNDSPVTKRYFYYGEESPKHKNRVSAFLVERMDGTDKVVAQITPLGQFKTTEVQSMLNIEAIKSGLTVTGEWTVRKNYHRCRVSK